MRFTHLIRVNKVIACTDQEVGQSLILIKKTQYLYLRVCVCIMVKNNKNIYLSRVYSVSCTTFSLEPAEKPSTSFRGILEGRFPSFSWTTAHCVADCISGCLRWCLWTLWLTISRCNVVITSCQLSSLLCTASRWRWTCYCTVWYRVTLLSTCLNK